MDRFTDVLDPTLLRALAQPTRVELLGALIACGGSAPVGRVAELVDVDLSVASRHLAELRRVGVLRSERRGKQRWLTLEVERLHRHFAEITRQLAALRDGLPCCAGAVPPGGAPSDDTP